MSFFRNKEESADRLPARTRPVPPDDTSPLASVSLLEDPVTMTLPALGPIPARPALPAPAPGPASLPPLPSGRHRAAWVPAKPPVPEPPTPREPAPVRITEPAALARDPDGRLPDLFTLRCGTCRRVHTTDGSNSFPALHAAAERAGWRKDNSGGSEKDNSGRSRFGVWACPACQAQPGWQAPNTPALCGEYLESALIRDVAAQASDVPVLDHLFQAQRYPRYFLDVNALEAATSA